MANETYARALAIIISKTILKNELLLLPAQNFRGGINTKAFIEGVEAIAAEVLRFFFDADSYDPNWTFEKQGEHPNIPEALVPAVYSLTYGKQEQDAHKKAQQGDYADLANLIETQGFLRSGSARRLVSSVLRDRRPPQQSFLNRDSALEVIRLMIEQDCTEYRACEIICENDQDLNAETFSTRIKRAKKQDKVVKLMFNLLKNRVQNI